MCSNMTRDQLKELFKAIDKDNNRTISVQELRNYFASIWDEDEAEGFAKVEMWSGSDHILYYFLFSKLIRTVHINLYVLGYFYVPL